MQNAEISLTDIPENSLTRFEHQGVKLVVVRTGSRVFAYEDQCPHAFWPLSEGSLNGTILECPGHGWEFNIETGRCLNSPDHCLTAVLLTVEDDVVYFQAPSTEDGTRSTES